MLCALAAACAQIDNHRKGLERIRKLGFHPSMVLDIGANEGHWTRSVKPVFPNAAFFMIEATPVHEPSLKQVGHPFEITLVGDANKTVMMHMETRGALLKSATGNSIYSEAAAGQGAFATRPRQMLRLDDLLAARNQPPAQLMKLDVQGAELDVLAGAPNTLASVEVIVVEVLVVAWNTGGPLWFEVHAELERLGYQLFDVLEMARGGTGMLLFVDLLFVRKDSKLWSKHATGIPAPSHGWPQTVGCTTDRAPGRRSNRVKPRERPVEQASQVAPRKHRPGEGGISFDARRVA